MAHRRFDHDEARRLRRKGWTLKAIAGRFGVSVTSAFVVSRGVNPPRCNYVVAGERARRFDHDEAQALREQGMTLRAIAKKVGVTVGAVHKATINPVELGL